MSRDFMCQFGDCESLKTDISQGGVTVTTRGERSRFCCEEHAAAYLIGCARRLHPHGGVSEKRLGDVQDAITKVRPPVTINTKKE
jgi:hypothetical protein